MVPTEEQRKRAAARDREKERKRKEVDAWREEKEAKEQQAKEREEARRASRGARVEEVCQTFLLEAFFFRSRTHHSFACVDVGMYVCGTLFSHPLF